MDNIKYLTWAISTIRDALSFNEYNLLSGKPLDRIEKELGILEGIKENGYTKEQFEIFFSDLLELGVATLPTTEKAIKKLGQ